MTKDELLEKAARDYPSGCSYIDTSGYKKRNITWDKNKPWFYVGNSIAISDGQGLVYNGEIWAVRLDENGEPIIENPTYEIY